MHKTCAKRTRCQVICTARALRQMLPWDKKLRWDWRSLNIWLQSHLVNMRKTAKSGVFCESTLGSSWNLTVFILLVGMTPYISGEEVTEGEEVKSCLKARRCVLSHSCTYSSALKPKRAQGTQSTLWDQSINQSLQINLLKQSVNTNAQSLGE